MDGKTRKGKVATANMGFAKGGPPVNLTPVYYDYQHYQ